MCRSRPLFVYFCPFHITFQIQLKKRSIDSVRGIRTWDHRIAPEAQTNPLSYSGMHNFNLIIDLLILWGDALARSIDRLSSIESYNVKRPGPSAIHQSHFFLIESRVTRFGEISPLWQILKVFGNFLNGYWIVCQIVNLWRRMFCPVSFLKLGKYWKNI